MSRNPSPIQAHRVASLALLGHTNDQIAAALSIPKDRAAKLKCEARKLGILAPFKPKSVADQTIGKAVRSSVAVGSMKDVFNSLTADEAVWLLKATPKDVSIAIFIASLIRDACAEEKEND